jgi:hypothetical protein
MYEQIQSQMIQMSKQFANAALQANTLALKNAEHLMGLQFKTLEERLNANVAFWGQASEARDIEGLKVIMPKGLELAKEHAERFAAVGQEMIASQLKTNQEIAELVKAQVKSANEEMHNVTSEAANIAAHNVNQAAEVVTNNVDKAFKVAARK